MFKLEHGERSAGDRARGKLKRSLCPEFLPTGLPSLPRVQMSGTASLMRVESLSWFLCLLVLSLIFQVRPQKKFILVTCPQVSDSIRFVEND